LIASEVAEALDVRREGEIDPTTEAYLLMFYDLMARFEEFRDYSGCGNHYDTTVVLDDYLLAYLEELVDIVIRVFSHVGGNNWTEQFIEVLLNKHGKSF
jgi:hypothetical protein